MLVSLQVRNFAIIDRVDVDFDAGMTVLTGETGAGKSILVDALGLVLGERGGTGLVREGAERAEFSAEFDLRQHAAARAWLREQALDVDERCVLRRVIGADGRSRAFINGTAVTLQNLKALGELLLDIHGQHFHESLGRRDVQRALVDHFGQLEPSLQATADAFAHWQELLAERAALEAAMADRSSRLELLGFQLGELEALALEPGQIEELGAERRRLQNVGRIADGLHDALQRIQDGEPENAHSLLAQARQSLDALLGFDERLGSAAELLGEALIQVSESAAELRRAAADLEADPARQEWVEERLAAIQAVARKHGVDARDLPQLQQELAAQLDELRRAEARSDELTARVGAAGDAYVEAATALGGGRERAAAGFAAAVERAMAGLGMPGGAFEVACRRRRLEQARPWGLEDVEYRISANPGQSPQPLARIASGGELSRMSLAIQVIASDGSAIPTMIFDEVDSGVGGGVAEMVGRRLAELGSRRQVLCVTHLPQVASQADHHLRIAKITDRRSTRTTVAPLTNDERIEELARMLGGMEITRRTREHAAEMLQKASSRGGRG